MKNTNLFNFQNGVALVLASTLKKSGKAQDYDYTIIMNRNITTFGGFVQSYSDDAGTDGNVGIMTEEGFRYYGRSNTSSYVARYRTADLIDLTGFSTIGMEITVTKMEPLTGHDNLNNYYFIGLTQATSSPGTNYGLFSNDVTYFESWAIGETRILDLSCSLPTDGSWYIQLNGRAVDFTINKIWLK